MDNRPNIWRRLQDHEMTPSPELFDRLLHALRVTHVPDADNPPTDTPLHTPTENGIRSLERLQQYITPPPAFIQSAIRNSTIGPGRSGWFPRFRFFYAAVAACMVIATGLILYLTHIPPQTRPKNVVRSASTPASTQPPKQGSSAPPVIAGDSSGIATAMAADATDSTASGQTITHIASNIKRPLSLYIDHRFFPLVDNDLLITLTSFKYPEVADHVGKVEDHAMTVHLDQYTNIVISKQIVAMIKEMYQTRSNGKPTRKARKMKDKLEDWKKADEKHFDSTAFFNAVDPIDLGDFILK